MSKTYNPLQQAYKGITSIGEGPGRQVYQLPIQSSAQQAIKYPLFAHTLNQLTPGLGDTPLGKILGYEPSRYDNFKPIEAEMLRQHKEETLPSIAQRYAGQGGSSGMLTRLSNAEHNLRGKLAAEKARFGQEEEKLSQSKLEGLLKFGMTPGFENVLMEPPKGEVPKTIEEQATAPIRDAMEQAKEKAADLSWSASDDAQKLPEKLASSPIAQQLVKNIPHGDRKMSAMLNVAGKYPASQWTLMSPNNKSPLSAAGFRNLYALSQTDFFKNNNSASIKNGLMQLRSEKDIERLINFIERGTVADIPSYLTKNKEWKDIRNQTVRELKGIGIGKGKVVTD